MDTLFLKRSIPYLTFLTLMLTFLYVANHFDTDYYFHLTYTGNGEYPPFLSKLMDLFDFNRSLGLFLINLLSTTYLPFILIHRITGKVEASIVYLYSGIPMALFVTWLVPQSIIHNLILLAIAFPWTIIFLGLIGPATHEFWYAGFVVIILGWMLFRPESIVYKWFNDWKSSHGT